MKKLIIIVGLLSSYANAFAQSNVEAMSIEGLSGEDSIISIASVEKQITLSEVSTDNYDLLVGVIATHEGKSTDYSPAASLYLTTFISSEEVSSASIHLLAGISELISAKQVDEGVYEATVKIFSMDECASKSKIGQKKITIKATKLLDKVKSLENTGDFMSHSEVIEAVTITEECL